MAASNDGTSASVAVATIAPVSAYPMTMACWMQRTGLTGTRTYCGLGSSSTSNLFLLQNSNNTARAYLNGSTASNGSIASGSGWTHQVAIATSTEIKHSINGAAATTAGHSTAFPAFDSFSLLGSYVIGTKGQAAHAIIAEIGLWDRELSQAEISALVKGYAPTCFRRGLRLYIPALAVPSGDVRDRISGTLLAGSLTHADHRAIRYPSRFHAGRTAAAPATAAPSLALTGVGV